MTSPAVKNPSTIRTAFDRLLIRLLSSEAKACLNLIDFEAELNYFTERAEESLDNPEKHAKELRLVSAVGHLWDITCKELRS